MTFGYMPRKNFFENIVLKIFGYPNFIRRIQAPILMRMLDPASGDRILDAGCGAGVFTFEAAKVCQSVGLDFYINKNLCNANKVLPYLSYVRADISKIPFKDESFDKILLSSVLQMIDPDDHVLTCCNRLLKRNGVLVLSVPVEYVYIKVLNTYKNNLLLKFKSAGKGYYPFSEIASLLRDHGFEIMEFEYSPKRAGSFLYESWLYVCYRLGLPLFHAFYFILYPIMYLDKLDKKTNCGCEIIIKARKYGPPDGTFVS